MIEILINNIKCLTLFVLLLFPSIVVGNDTNQKNIILLIHGIKLNINQPNRVWGNCNKNEKYYWNGMVGYLQNRGYAFGGIIKSKRGNIRLPDCLDKTCCYYNPVDANVFVLEFSKAASTDGLAFKCLELSECIKELLYFTNCKSISIVAHSAGGLVARAYVQKALPSVDYCGHVNKLITVGTPHFGSAYAKFGDLLGTRVTSLKPNASIINDLNNTLTLPQNILYASIIIRGFAADVRGSGYSYDPYIDPTKLSNLPIDFKYGGDQGVHVKSQNLALAKCAQLYEKLTQRPILNPIIRVTDPSPKDTSLNDEQVHTFAPNSPNVQKKLYLLLQENNALWKKKQKNQLEKQVENDIINNVYKKRN